MNKKILIYLVMTMTWFMFTASTCVIGESFPMVVFEVTNNTSDTLVWHSDHMETLAYLDLGAQRLIPPNETKTVEYYCPEMDIRVFFSLIGYGYSPEIFISLDTIRKYGWEDVVNNNRVYQYYDLCYDDAVRIQAHTRVKDSYTLRFTVPPADYMSEVKMWPPYGYYE